MSGERIKQRADGRKVARELVTAGFTPVGPHGIDAFLDELRTLLQPELVKQERIARQRKLSELKSHAMTFGAHQGQCLDDIPRDYLEWLLQSSEDLVGTLSQYLKLTADSAAEANDDES